MARYSRPKTRLVHKGTGTVTDPRIEIETTKGSGTIAVLIDGRARIGLITGDADCDDPTLVVWNDIEADDGEAVMVLHLGVIPFGQHVNEVTAAIATDIAKGP